MYFFLHKTWRSSCSGSSRGKKLNTISKRVEGQGLRTEGVGGGERGGERLARSRSYPGFSIGILLSVKVILPVNGVFIPPLN